MRPLQHARELLRALALVLSFVAAGAAAQEGPRLPDRGRFRSIDGPVSESGSGDFDAMIVVRMINSRRAALVRCYEVPLRDDPTLHGRVLVRLTIEPSGAVTDVGVAESDFARPEIGDCAVRVFSGFRFSTGPEGGSVTYTFALDYVLASM